jgi:hypothetical protein
MVFDLSALFATLGHAAAAGGLIAIAWLCVLFVFALLSLWPGSFGDRARKALRILRKRPPDKHG